MKFKFGASLALASIVLFACSKKPPVVPPPEPPAPKVVETPEPLPSLAPDTLGQGRHRLQTRIAATFKTIYFDYDKSALPPEGQSICEAIGQLMKEVPSLTVRIEGNADERGTNEYNLALGDRRAKAVQAYLTSYGIASSRLSELSFGEEKPAVDGHDEAAWSKNRRVDFSPSF